MMNILDFGTILRELREASGMTQEQLARKIGVSKSSVSLYELHQRLPYPDTLAEIARAFRVSTDYLLGIDKGKRIDVSELDEREIEAIEHMIRVLIENKKK